MQRWRGLQIGSRNPTLDEGDHQLQPPSFVVTICRVVLRGPFLESPGLKIGLWASRRSIFGVVGAVLCFLAFVTVQEITVSNKYHG